MGEILGLKGMTMESLVSVDSGFVLPVVGMLHHGLVERHR
jgi:hypothetical protein